MSGCHAREWEVNLKKKQKKKQKKIEDRAKNEKGPLGCYTIWNSVLERLR